MEKAEATKQTEQRRLSCKLTQAEFNVRAMDYAKLDEELDKLEIEKKRVTDEIKDRIGGVEHAHREMRMPPGDPDDEVPGLDG